MQDVAAQAYGMAGVGPSDVDALMCYDNFSPTVLFSLEGVLRKPLSERARNAAMRLGIAMLAALMIFATYNDLRRLFK